MVNLANSNGCVRRLDNCDVMIGADQGIIDTLLQAFGRTREQLGKSCKKCVEMDMNDVALSN